MSGYVPVVRVLVRARSIKGLRRVVRILLRCLAVDIPTEVQIEWPVHVYHNWIGVVISRHARIGRNVSIFHGVTIGRRDPYVPESESPVSPIVIEDDAFLCVGAVILGGDEEVRVGRGTVVGANAVLTRSTGQWEIWAGNPARKVGDREIVASQSS